LENERRAWIFLNHITDLGPIRFHRLLHFARSAEAILELPVSGLQAAGVSIDLVERWHRALRDPAQLRWLETEMQRLDRGTCHAVIELDDEYPGLLRELSDRPPVLYYKGRWPLPEIGVVGVVGTRRPTPYGLTVTERLVRELTQERITTISGLASGIDACAHEAAIKSGGHTVAVLGCGLGKTYPRENKILQEQIATKGTLISEFPYETEPLAYHFPRRNRIISGLSQGVVVIEAGDRSGALITARYAAEQGREVFAVPGSIFHTESQGCHRLIKEGAKLANHVKDILDELKLPKKVESPVAAATEYPLSALEQHIYNIVSEEPISVDEITHRSAQGFEQVANSLLALELKGIIRHLPGQRYARS
jgi:DNA processing protein